MGNTDIIWTPFISPLKMEEKLLSKIIEKLELIEVNTASKEHYQIIVSKNKSDFNTIFNPPIQLDKNKQYEIALVDLETYYSFPNINETNNVIQYRSDGGDMPAQILIPVGSYEFKGLNKEIERQLTQNGDKNAFKLTANLNTFKSLLDVKPGYEVLFTHNANIGHLLGFAAQGYGPGHHVSEHIVNILAINSIFIHINIINGSYVNGSQEPVIYSFFPKVGPGYKIVERPTTPMYLPVTLNTIRDLHVKITDQNSIPLNVRGEEVTIRFHLREK